jgi:hypothetical protein
MVSDDDSPDHVYSRQAQEALIRQWGVPPFARTHIGGTEGS